jgi:urate oxidase
LVWKLYFKRPVRDGTFFFEQLESTFTTVEQSSQCRFNTLSKIEGLVLVKSSTNENVFFLKIAGTFSHLGMILKQENDKGLV